MNGSTQKWRIKYAQNELHIYRITRKGDRKSTKKNKTRKKWVQNRYVNKKTSVVVIAGALLIFLSSGIFFFFLSFVPCSYSLRSFKDLVILLCGHRSFIPSRYSCRSSCTIVYLRGVHDSFANVMSSRWWRSLHIIRIASLSSLRCAPIRFHPRSADIVLPRAFFVLRSSAEPKPHAKRWPIYVRTHRNNNKNVWLLVCFALIVSFYYIFGHIITVAAAAVMPTGCSRNSWRPEDFEYM